MRSELPSVAVPFRMWTPAALVWVLAAATCAQAARPENHLSDLIQGMHRGAEDDESVAPASAKPRVCFLQKDDLPDGVGHQLFTMLTVMGGHGVVGDTGVCLVYNVAPRDFVFQHMDPESQSWKEAMSLMRGFYEEVEAKVGPRGCATAELIAKSPKETKGSSFFLKDVCESEEVTWSLDNLVYGSDFNSYNHRQLMSKPSGFMQAVIKNSSQLAVLAASHLPHVADTPAMAVHMRFGDRTKYLLPIAEGQQALFQSSEFQSMASLFSPMRVFSDSTEAAKPYLTGAVAGAELYGRERSTAVQALASMVGAEVFVGSCSDLSSTAALMRIGLGKKHTYMPSNWQWANGFSEEELTIYDVANHLQESCPSGCDTEPDGLCYSCGRHPTDLGLKFMNCCEIGGSYPPEHACHGASYGHGSAGQRQCVLR